MLPPELIHSDLCETFPIYSLIRSLYFIMLVDDFLNKILIYFFFLKIIWGQFYIIKNEVENFMGNQFRLFRKVHVKQFISYC
jgi:hypothetical protein